VLDWAEAWNGGVTTDLDVYLVDQTTGFLLTGSSANNNIASQQAFEFFTKSLPSTSDQWGLVVARKSAAAPAATPRFKIVFAENGGQPFSVLQAGLPAAGTTDVMGPTTYGHNGSADAMTLGASDVRVATSLNGYSSYGPVTTLFGPVNGVTPAAALPSARVVAKPDLVASDCQKNTFLGGGTPPRFCGTSAAAPHAAAVAALLRQKFPASTTAAINAALVATATPIAGVAASFQGAGLLNALAAIRPLTPPPPPPTPDTLLTKTPKKTVKTTKKKAKVSFTFTSTVAGATFTCSVDGKAFAPCASGVTVKLKAGKHTFAVRATASGVTDATPATVAFKVKRKKKHHH
jgi:subtilisin family serine protease